jgi:hypothetical protein
MKIRIRGLRALFLLALLPLSASFAGAQDLTGTQAPPDFSVCMNNGWRSLESSTGFSFREESDCLLVAALGGNFGNFSGNTQFNFFITNLTSRDINLSSIKVDSSHDAGAITSGGPELWKAGETLRLSFSYPAPAVATLNPAVIWNLNVQDNQDYFNADVTFQVNATPYTGWFVYCASLGSLHGVCDVSADGTHIALRRLGRRLR